MRSVIVWPVRFGPLLIVPMRWAGVACTPANAAPLLKWPLGGRWLQPVLVWARGDASLSPHRARLLWVSFSLSVAPASSSLCPAFEALLSHRAVSIHFSELLSAEWSGSLVVRGSASGSTAVAVQAVKWRSRSSGALTWRRLRSVYAGAVIWQAFDKRRDPRDPACLSPCIPSSGRFVACVHLILRIPKRAFRSPSIGSRAARF